MEQEKILKTVKISSLDELIDHIIHRLVVKTCKHLRLLGSLQEANIENVSNLLAHFDNPKMINFRDFEFPITFRPQKSYKIKITARVNPETFYFLAKIARGYSLPIPVVVETILENIVSLPEILREIQNASFEDFTTTIRKRRYLNTGQIPKKEKKENEEEND